jgi:hypothetical protein
MSEQVTQALEMLRDLAPLDEMRRLAEQGAGPASRPKVNSHIHLPPNFSAFTTVQQAVDLARAQGVSVLGVSNYYDYSVYGDFVERAKQAGIFPLFGLEIISMIDDLRDSGVLINDPGNPGKTYICGKGITRFADGAGPGAMTTEGQRLLSVIRANDAQRMREMTDKVEAIFVERGVATGVGEDEVIQMIVKRHGSPRESVYIQERHIAQAFQEALAAKVAGDERIEKLNTVLGAATKASGPDDGVTIQGDIRSHLMKAGKPAFVGESFLSFAEARQLILEMGGIPCYPTLADGTSPRCGFEATPAELIAQLTERGVHAAEFIPIRNSPAVLSEYVLAMRKAGLVITGGTEHNTLDLIGIEPTCAGGEPVPDEVKDVFWEGACVVASHQHLTLNGETGYVDAEGHLNAAYSDDEARITALARLGAAVIGQYDRKCAK